ncbi:MAG: TIGR03032 family protein, partial [Bacteroidota bacterium]
EKAQENLRGTAKTAGIDPQRLYFAKWLPYGEYLKGFQLCDLYLDTWHYSAGSTAISALGAGLPVLTVTHDSNASRMGACIVAAAGLTDLICDSLESYQSRAISLLVNPKQLQFYKAQLREHPATLPLFDNAQFAKKLEDAFFDIWEQRRDSAE